MTDGKPDTLDGLLKEDSEYEEQLQVTTAEDVCFWLGVSTLTKEWSGVTQQVNNYLLEDYMTLPPTTFAIDHTVWERFASRMLAVNENMSFNFRDPQVMLLWVLAIAFFLMMVIGDIMNEREDGVPTCYLMLFVWISVLFFTILRFFAIKEAAKNIVAMKEELLNLEKSLNFGGYSVSVESNKNCAGYDEIYIRFRRNGTRVTETWAIKQQVV